MFGMLDIPGITTESVYFLRSYGPLLVAASVGATPLVRDLSLRLDRHGWVWLPRTAVALFLLLICTAYLVDGSFNPFLYFRF